MHQLSRAANRCLHFASAVEVSNADPCRTLSEPIIHRSASKARACSSRSAVTEPLRIEIDACFAHNASVRLQSTFSLFRIIAFATHSFDFALKTLARDFLSTLEWLSILSEIFCR